MSPTTTFEAGLLAKPAACLASFLCRHAVPALELRMQVLEASASRLGGFDLGEFHAAFGTEPLLPQGPLLDCACELGEAIHRCGIPPALALSALARGRPAGST